jgi:copper(I)-binding protein
MKKLLPVLLFWGMLSPVLAADRMLSVRSGWAYLSPNTQKLTVLFTVVNPTKNKDVMTEVVTPLADVVKIYALSKRSDGIKRHQQIKQLEILPFSVLQLDSAGYEVVLYNPKKTLQMGEKFPLFFTFEKAGDRKIMVEIKEK